MIKLFPQPRSQGVGRGIKETTLQTFKADVLDASRTVAVLVDFWAPWCEPCRKISPVLEKLVGATKGAVVLVKVNIDQSGSLRHQLGIHSIPAVYAFFQGRPIDYFIGILQESQITQFIRRVIKLSGGKQDTTLESLMAQAADALKDADHQEAARLYTDVLRLDPHNVTAYAALVRCRIAAGERQHAHQMIQDLPENLKQNKELTEISHTLDVLDDLHKEGQNVRNIDILQPLVDTNPDDHPTRFELSLAYYMNAQRHQAVDHLLEIIKRQPEWQEGKAHTYLLKLFDAFGITDPLTVATRRRLAALLFS